MKTKPTRAIASSPLCLLAILTLTCACQPKDDLAPTAQPPKTNKPAGPKSADPPKKIDATKKDKNVSHQTFEGRLDIDRLVGGKRLQATYLVPNSGGDSLLISYRATPEYYQYVDKQVVLTGVIDYPDPRMQSVGGPHLSVLSIELADGETPYDPIPTELPQPPLCDTQAELKARLGRWAQTYATISAIKPSEDQSFWVDLEMTLPNGETFRIKNASKSDTEGQVGTQVTVLGYVRDSLDSDGAVIFGRVALCEGKHLGCGMPILQDDGRKALDTVAKEHLLKAKGATPTKAFPIRKSGPIRKKSAPIRKKSAPNKGPDIFPDE